MDRHEQLTAEQERWLRDAEQKVVEPYRKPPTELEMANEHLKTRVRELEAENASLHKDLQMLESAKRANLVLVEENRALHASRDQAQQETAQVRREFLDLFDEIATRPQAKQASPTVDALAQRIRQSVEIRRTYLVSLSQLQPHVSAREATIRLDELDSLHALLMSHAEPEEDTPAQQQERTRARREGTRLTWGGEAAWPFRSDWW